MKYKIGDIIQYTPVQAVDWYFIGKILNNRGGPFQEYIVQWVEYVDSKQKKSSDPNYNDKNFIDNQTILIGGESITFEEAQKELV